MKDGASPGIRVIYVAGYSRSGSTLLDIILGSAPGVVGGGEMAFIADDYLNEVACSCGQAIPHCPVWAEAFEDASQAGHYAEARKAFESAFLGCAPSLRRHESRHSRRDYVEATLRVFRSVQGSTGAHVVVDSSKSARGVARRAKELSRMEGLDVRIVHISRRSSETALSYQEKGSNWVLEGKKRFHFLPGVRSVVGWRAANGRVLDDARRAGSAPYLHVRYEDFLAQPDRVLRDLEAFCGIDLSEARDRIRQGEAFHAGHQVGGNRLRHGRITVRTGDAQGARGSLHAVTRVLDALLARRLNRRLGHRG